MCLILNIIESKDIPTTEMNKMIPTKFSFWSMAKKIAKIVKNAEKQPMASAASW